ncbi:TIGR00268 family protein [Candidatus Synechococcus spongiarum LMB bulk10E]|nr:TIGR00268 family protein [Candidatus Synechococcus spongiarum LMB bulk10E]OOV36809.1 TIGR00268 family protein [Candidatus Synechococcus spongiarum LMB bulk10D]
MAELPLQEELSPGLQKQLAQLRGCLRRFGAVVVAYSGGVDSSLVAAVAVEQLGDTALAVTGVSPALAPHLRREARWQAQWLGIRHQEVATRELHVADYANNPPERCYACKATLHHHLANLEPATAGAQVVDGVNRDDLGDHRPGIAAARQRGGRSPLVDSGIGKLQVRQLSRALGLPWWDKPAQPCLSSRFPYGEPITAQGLERVAAAEAWLLARGYRQVRVRSQGSTARIEIPAAAIADFLSHVDRSRLVAHFRKLGFTAVGLDLEGLVSGKLNRSLLS